MRDDEGDMRAMGIREKAADMCFGAVHGNNLVYNQCWEDPRLDRVALNLTPADNVMVITSAGCNALDYALAGANHVYAVDINSRQNALLEMKLAAARTLDHTQFFRMFGQGVMPEGPALYPALLRPALSPEARVFWDRHIAGFGRVKGRPSFYFQGASGLFARMVNFYIDRVAKVRGGIEEMLAAPTVADQRRIYDETLRDAFWGRTIRWFLGRSATMSLLGVPYAQRVQLEEAYGGGIAKFVEHCVENVFAVLPFHDNYFWRVYLTGTYTQQSCPEYLKVENFEAMKAIAHDRRVTTHTATVEAFLKADRQPPISRFVLLDHMDWMAMRRTDALAAEWQAIVNRAAPGARVLWRSGALKVDFVDPLKVMVAGRSTRVGDILSYHRELATELHKTDRVHTYGSFHIADLATA